MQLKRAVILLALAGASTLTLRLLLDSSFGTGTLVYLAVPFILSVALWQFTPSPVGESVGTRYWAHMRAATIVFLATSAFLFEGFICILMFMPIYYIAASLGFAVRLGFEKRDDTDVFRVAVLPVVAVLLVSEGLVPATTMPREQTSTFIADSPLSVAELKANMAQPIDFEGERHWFLEIFPLPDQIAAGSLAEGDVHQMHFTYRRWLVTNVQRGQMHVRIDHVGERDIATSITRNDSYLASYLKIHGTRINFTPLADGGTRIKLSVLSRRTLDPSWYFGPMQSLATRQSARFFIETIIARHPVEEIAS